MAPAFDTRAETDGREPLMGDPIAPDEIHESDTPAEIYRKLKALESRLRAGNYECEAWRAAAIRQDKKTAILKDALRDIMSPNLTRIGEAYALANNALRKYYEGGE